MAIANQKGGVGKSTTAVSLGAALAELGFRILVVDLDPQGNASTGIGIRHEHRAVTSYDVIVSEAPLADAIVHSPVKGLDAIPSTIDLAGAEIELVSQFSREGRLKRALTPVREGVYDFIFLDCPPSLGLITVNALTAAEELIVPIQCEYYALEGLGQLLRNVSLVQQNINQELRLTGIVMTMFDPRTKLSEQVVEEVQRYFGDLVYDTIIPRTVRLSEAPGYGVPITVYDPRSKGAESYRMLASEVALRPTPAAPMPTFDDLPVVVAPQIVPDREPASPPPDEVFDEELPSVHEVMEEAAEEAAAPSEPKPDAQRSVPQEGPKAERPATPPPVARSAPAVEQVPPAPAVQEAIQPEPEAVWEPPEEEAPRVRAIRSDPGHLPERRVVVIDEDAGVPAGPKRSVGMEPEDDPTIGATLEDDGQKRRWRLFRKGGE
jgi:chromosome partitioning protein